MPQPGLDGFARPDNLANHWDPASAPTINMALGDSDFEMDGSNGAVGNMGQPETAIRGSSLQFANPSGTPQRISRGQWDLHRPEIERQHPLMTLPELRRHIEKKHGFTASEQQWKKKLAEWRLSKNIPQRVTKFIKKKAQRRLLGENKETTFRLNHKPIPMDKVERHLQSGLTELENDVSLTGSTPDHVSYNTYKSPRPQHTENKIVPDLPDAYEKRPMVVMALWQAKSVDEILETAARAIKMSADGNYLAAKPMFMESLDGLSALLPPDHPQTINLLDKYVAFAISGKDFEEATDRLHTSYNDHIEKLGSEAKMTWVSLSRLGRLYREQCLNSQAYHMLFNARQGILLATASLEEAFIFSRPITSKLIDIAVEQCNFQEAESESLRQISQVEALGGAYEADKQLLKHSLVHLYTNIDWKNQEDSIGPPRPRTRVEDILLELFRSRAVLGANSENMYLCACDNLREFYGETGQLSKLEALLPELQSVVDATDLRRNHSAREKTIALCKGISSSYRQLRDWDKAVSCLLQLEERIEKSPHYGSRCHERLSAIMHISRLYLDQGDIEKARPWLEKAQEVGRVIFPAEHDFHASVSKYLEAGFIDDSVCTYCLIEPGRVADRLTASTDLLRERFENFLRTQTDFMPPVHDHSKYRSCW
ncbi:hypothetical protein VTL71DRAFT_1110 [Oculimacula yallundae]|uniref:Clr5 domain-containing protein n=1 Tax=Oculimacula yallundae TaxID=86028 RepID=A0ABR4D1X2_9HELO